MECRLIGCFWRGKSLFFVLVLFIIDSGMRNLYVFAVLLAFTSFFAQAQSDCGGGRYEVEVFSNYVLTSNITYGSNTNLQGQNQSLELDIYEPEGDQEPLRPLIVMEHGGSFIGGTKDAVDITTIAQPLARQGYVIASIEYRLGMAGLPFPGPDSIDASTAVWRAVADFKAAVRFFYKSVQNGNPYRIDTNRLYIGGVSAGAVAAVHYAYLDDINEMPSYIDTTLAGTGGGIEGNSGNQGYSSRIHGVVNICGMIADTAWMSPNDEPIVSLHGTADAVVPYGSAMITVGGFYPIFVVDGSHSIMLKANDLGLDNCMFTYVGADHTPHINGGAYLDTTLNVVSNFMHHLVCNTPAVCSPEVSNTDAFANTAVAVYPNPADESFTVEFSGLAPIEWNYELYDLTGRLVVQGKEENTAQHRFNRGNLTSGMYTLKVFADGFNKVERVVLR
jgi:para-nitrobenzyl esterase